MAGILSAIIAPAARLLAAILSPVARWVLWTIIKLAVDEGATDASGERIRTWLIDPAAKRLQKCRDKGGNAGHVAPELARCWSVALHSNRLWSMAQGASYDSAMTMPDEQWSRRGDSTAPASNTTRFSGEHQP